MTKVSNVPEGSVLSARQIRILKISIAVMTALLIAGIAALFYGMARQASRLGATPALRAPESAPYQKQLDLGKGEIASVAADAGLIIMHWRGETDDSVIVFAMKDGHEVGRIQVARK